MRKSSTLWLITVSVFLFAACKSSNTAKQSSTTGWKYNDAKQGAFEVFDYTEQATGPGLVLIPGGTFTMGAMDQDVMFDYNNIPHKVTISSFYMDECEVSNLDYLEYLNWLKIVFVNGDKGFHGVYNRALPDEKSWRSPLAFMEDYFNYYFRSPAFRNYPVVGVTWIQATQYAEWRTDRVNEKILADMKFVNWNQTPSPEGYFNTDAYLNYNEYEAQSDRRLQFITTNEYRNVMMEDGILLPKYRLPTEAEWEYAAIGVVGNAIGEQIVERNTYPWSGRSLRSESPKYMGDFQLNFKRGQGDYSGVATHLNPGSIFTDEVRSFWPNDFGLYNMAGNVAEWVSDVYRPNGTFELAEYNPYRGNIYQSFQRNPDGTVVERDSIGRIPMILDDPDTKNERRTNYRNAYNVNYKDGDFASLLNNDNANLNIEGTTEMMYRRDLNNPYSYSLISDNARVVKGGSWKDIAYWAQPGNRRFLAEDEATDYIGFRCAMSRLGALK